VTLRPLVWREQAERDFDDAVGYYLTEGGDDLAIRFVEAVDVGLRHVAVQPATGSPRYAVELQMSGLRSWRLKKFPYLLAYFDGGDCIELVRVLHERRDIAEGLQVLV
jgi:toxin ParE1/3/4